MNALSDNEFKKYKYSGGMFCPKCGERGAESAGSQHSGGGIDEVVFCPHCKAEWIERYDLYEVEIKEPAGPGEGTEMAIKRHCNICGEEVLESEYMWLVRVSRERDEIYDWVCERCRDEVKDFIEKRTEWWANSLAAARRRAAV